MPYERMLDKRHELSPEEISAHIGPRAEVFLAELEGKLADRYDLKRELRFPFGNQYGWGYKYAHKAKHLIYLFFEKEALTAMLQLGDGPAASAVMPSLSPYAQELWANRYPCGNRDGGWIHYRITEAGQIDEVIELVRVKCPVKR